MCAVSLRPPEPRTSRRRPSGLPFVGDLAWGSHVCQFYEEREDLLETIVPFFAAGLDGDERCVWLVSKSLGVMDATAALKRSVPDLDARILNGQVEIIESSEWHERAGRPNAPGAVLTWLEMEQIACASGYTGLRVAGNVTWLGEDAWTDFSTFETAIHRALRGRRMLLLCSYHLATCGPNRVFDVLRNHGSALVRSGGSWRSIRRATDLLAALDAGRIRAQVTPRHLARFYREGSFPAARIAEFLARSLRSESGAIIIATKDHSARILGALYSAGLDVPALTKAGDLVVEDAEDVARELLASELPLRSAFDEIIGKRLGQLAARRGFIRAYGEVSPVLARDGKTEAAIELEEHAGSTVDTTACEFLCGYDLDDFASASSVPAFRRVCAAHGHVEPAEEESRVDTARLLAELQQSIAALEGESTRAKKAADQTGRFRRFSSALQDCSTSEELAKTTVEQLARAPRIFSAALVAPDDDGVLRVLASTEERSGAFAESVAVEPFRTGLAVWSEEAACVPLVAAGRTLGVVVLLLVDVLEDSDKALLADCAALIAIALDRARACERAEAASRAKEQFLAMLGHELRNPLSPILTAVELMRLRADDTLVKERTVIERQARHMARLVDDLLDVTKISAGKVHLSLARIELSTIVSDAIEFASPMLEEKAHELTVRVQQRGLLIHGDRQRLSQVLVNLLTNAAKYTPPNGHIQIRARTQAGRVTLEVEDDGVGIEPELRERIFRLFEQGAQGLDRANGGLGLGLTIAKNLVERHGGSLGVQSRGRGAGATFSMDLPLVAFTSESRRPKRRRRASEPPPRRVLVVDDNVDAACVLGETIEALGHTVAIAHDGPAALELIADLQPEVALLDIGLPGMDGYELAERLRALMPESPPFLVAVTGYGQESDRARSKRAGFVEHLVKPIELATVRGVLKKASGVPFPIV